MEYLSSPRRFFVSNEVLGQKVVDKWDGPEIHVFNVISVILIMNCDGSRRGRVKYPCDESQRGLRNTLALDAKGGVVNTLVMRAKGGFVIPLQWKPKGAQ